MENFIEIYDDYVKVREATKQGYAIAVGGDSINLEQPNSKTRRGRVGKEISNTLTCSCNQGVVEVNKIIKTIIPQQVRIRKHEVDIGSLKILLRESKSKTKITNKEISNKLNKSLTLVEHWFRNDNSFSIPTDDIWFKLKELLNIETDQFDKSIMEFEIRDGVFDKSNRVYDTNGIAPTLTCVSAENERYIVYESGDGVSEPKLVGGIGEINFGKQFRQGNRIYDAEEIAMCLMAQPVGNAGGFSYLYQIKEKGDNNMWKNNLERFNFKMEEIRVFDIFAGIGSLHKSLKKLGVPVRITNLSEVDIDAIISYGAIHIENFKDLEFEFPSVEEMRSWLIERNIGYDFEKNKSKIIRLNGEKLKLLYKASYLLNNLGDVSKIDTKDIEDFDLMNLSFCCFKEGTLVLTNKGYKKIENITDEDYVLTHTNEYKKVVKPMKRKSDHLYRLKTMPSEDLLVTDEHPFYVRKRHNISTRKNGKSIKFREFDEPKWIEMKNLSKDYYVGVAINQKEELPLWNGTEVNTPYRTRGNKKILNNIHNYFENENFWWIVGRYMGDGWIKNSIDYKGTDIYDLYICCAKDELQDIIKVLDKINLINNDFKYKYYEKRTTYEIRISNVEFAKFLQQFGKGAEGKHLNETIINLPKMQLKSFLEGYMSADGCFTQKHFKASSVSRDLIYGIGQCVAKVYNRPYSIYHTIRKPTCIIEGRVVNQRDTYEVKWKMYDGKQDKAFYENGYIWCPINKIEKEEYDGYVYNMEVSEDNSYTANGIIVHNCQDISGAGKQKGLRNEDGTPTRSGLIVPSLKLARAKKPKYIMIENVKALIQKKFIDDFYDIVNELEEMGYNCYYPTKEDKKGNKYPMCLNSKDFGIPQNRERIYVICIRKDIDNGNFEFPIGRDFGIRLKDLLEDKVDEKYYLSDDIQKRFKPNDREDMNRNELNIVGTSAPECRTIGQRDVTYGINGVMSTLTATDYKQPKQILDAKVNRIGGVFDTEKSNHQAGSVYDQEGLSPTIDTMQGGWRQPCIKVVGNLECEGWHDIETRVHSCDGISPTIETHNRGKYMDSTEIKIRKLTPLECWRLMGFDDEDFHKAQELGVSDSQLYKQAGNSIVVNVLYYIFKNLFKEYII